MSKVRLAAKKDANQDDIVRAARAYGFTVKIVHQIPGCLDLLVGKFGLDQRVEVKDPNQPPSKRRLTDWEQDEFDRWRGRPPVVWETEQDIAATHNQMLQDSIAIKSKSQPQEELFSDW